MTVIFIAKITKAYTRHYRDNGQTTAYVEWIDRKGQAGRTEGPAHSYNRVPIGNHMYALFQRALREGVKIERETW